MRAVTNGRLMGGGVHVLTKRFRRITGQREISRSDADFRVIGVDERFGDFAPIEFFKWGPNSVFADNTSTKLSSRLHSE
jgi:hypothetical protein